jgi:pimeloyl-ACP methyl ester carboxylesterase
MTGLTYAPRTWCAGYRRARILAAMLVALAAVPAVAGEQLIDIALGDGLRQRVLYDSPPAPVATIVMLPGGDGEVDITAQGDFRHGDNFVVRSRALWLSRGYAVLIPDTIARENLRGLRSSPGYGELIADLARFANSRLAKPVFLLGTSQGSIAAANGAAHLPPGALAGVVLTESVSRIGGSRESVFSVPLGKVTAPALVVANRDDACDVAPPMDAPQIVAALAHSPDARLLTVGGGQYRSKKPCGSLTPHGYYGIEAPVVDAIAQWMGAHLG